jgi:hypothetical protein
MKTALAIGLFWALSIGCAGAHDIEVSTGVVCNTQKQVEEFAAFNESAPQAAIRDVNDEERDPTACTVASLAFIRGHRATTMRTSRATFQIAEILVIGVVTREGIQSLAPSIQFSLFKIDERAV